MSDQTDIWNTTAVEVAAIAANSGTAAAADLRGDILQMTQAAEDAVLRPINPGRWPHSLRAALASRIARLNGAETLEEKYQAMISSNEDLPLANPGTTPAEADLKACFAFMDRVATSPREVGAEDIKALQDSGIEDADIVRLTELNAFLAYQLRLVHGLSLLAGADQ